MKLRVCIKGQYETSIIKYPTHALAVEGLNRARKKIAFKHCKIFLMK
jgi:hypothetical protein